MSDYEGIDLGEDFDVEVESMEFEDRSYEPVPDGKYMLELSKIEDKPTKSGGKMLAATFRIIDGAYENRLIFENFNYKGSSEQAVRIATEQLGKMCKAVGVPSIRYPSECLHKPLIGKVSVQKSKNPDYPYPQNRIVEYYSIDDAGAAPEPPKQVGPKSASGPSSRPASTGGPAKSASGGSRPWDRKAS